MGLRPTHGNENPHPRRPREGGNPRWVDSRFRGNDAHNVTFRKAAGDEESRTAFKIEIPRFALSKITGHRP